MNYFFCCRVSKLSGFSYFQYPFTNKWNSVPSHHLYSLEFVVWDWYVWVTLYVLARELIKIHSEEWIVPFLLAQFPNSVLKEMHAITSILIFNFFFNFFFLLFYFFCMPAWDFRHFTAVTIKIITPWLWKHYTTFLHLLIFSTLPFPCILHPVISTHRNYPTKFQLVFLDCNLLYLVQHLPVVACFPTHLRQALYSCYPSSSVSEQF